MPDPSFAVTGIIPEETAAWWTSLLGVALGGLIGFGSNFFTWRWGRDERTSERIRAEVLPVAARFLSAARDAWDQGLGANKASKLMMHQLHENARRLGVPVDAPANTYKPEPGLNRAFLESLDAHQTALVICRKALAELSLVCPQVDPAADRLLASVTWAYSDEAIGPPVPDEHRLAEYDDSRALFIERVRDEIYGSSQVRRRRSKV